MSIPLMPTHRTSVSGEALAAHPATNTQGVQQPVGQSPQQMADRTATDWNVVHAAMGSFADEHSTL